MKQIVIGAIGIAAGAFIIHLRVVPITAAGPDEMRSGYWKGRYVEVTGRLNRTGKGVYLVDEDGEASLRVKGMLPQEKQGNPVTLSGRVGRNEEAEREESTGKVQWVLDTGASRMDLVTAVALIVVVWGFGLVWAGLMVKKAGKAEPVPLEPVEEQPNPSRDEDRQ